MSFSNYLEQTVLDYVYGLTAFTPSGFLYVGLSTTTPGEDASNFTEPASASGYSRAIIHNAKSSSGWIAASQNSTSGQLTNAGTVTFPIASGNWGTVTSYGLFDRPTGTGTPTNMYNVGALSTSRAVVTNDTLSFASGAFIIRID